MAWVCANTSSCPVISESVRYLAKKGQVELAALTVSQHTRPADKG